MNNNENFHQIREPEQDLQLKIVSIDSEPKILIKNKKVHI